MTTFARSSAHGMNRSNILITPSPAASAKPRTTRHLRYGRSSSRHGPNPNAPYHLRKTLAEYAREELEAQNQCMFHQRVCIFAKNNMQALPLPHTSVHKLYDPENPVFKHILEMELLRVFTDCETDSFTYDKPAALFLCMGEYTLLVLESAEDTVGCICRRLTEIADHFWLANRVFLIEDHIEECYFSSFVCRRAAAININEKFPAYTTTDVELMGLQHFTIVEKVHSLCERIADTLADNLMSQKSSLQMRTDTNDILLPPSDFNRLMPEVQRIELVLNCSRFYRDLKTFAILYEGMPREENDDAQAWPIPYNYTPMGVFTHSVYDVNLTFSDYGKKEEDAKEKGTEETSSDDELKEEPKQKPEEEEKEEAKEE